MSTGIEPKPESGYACGTCGSLVLVIESLGPEAGWQLRCSNGHEWVSVMGTRIVIEPTPTPSTTTEEAAGG